MNINRKEYLNKVRGCFLGKNIGGTLGGPYEGKREVLDVKGFITKKGEPLPNDDLDLQLVWLTCLEFEGPRNVTSETLGDYWNGFVCMYANEYGISKTNISNGFMPSIAGDMPNNIWKHSNGAWIRTEIWACVCPGAIDEAVRFAIEDAVVDHGYGEGSHAACFIAALESAAFFESNLEKLIEIGLSKVAKDSRLHKTIALVLDEYKKGSTWLETREKVIKLNSDLPDGGWFQAPNNIAFVVIGLLYGKGDFKQSMITAINCSDDTDCTAATVGSILGIMYGEDRIPQEWKDYIGNDIKTVAINPCVAFRGPKTIDELVERVSFQAPQVLRVCKTKVTISDEPTSLSKEEENNLEKEWGYMDERDFIRGTKLSFKPNTFKVKNGGITTIVTYKDGATISENETKTIEIVAVNNIKEYGNMDRSVVYEVMAPNGATCKSKIKEVFLPNWSPMTPLTYADPIKFNIAFNTISNKSETVLLKVIVNPIGKEYYVPIKFLAK